MSLSNPNSHFEMALPVKYEELSREQRRNVRRQYQRIQNNECFFCGSSLYEGPSEELEGLPIDWSLFPEGFLDYPVHLQHNHATGLTEGAVHSFCNAFMWNYFRR